MPRKSTFPITKRIIFAASIGNLLEIYSFSLFTMLLPVLIPIFFPSSDPIAALLSAYLVFSVGFLAYPIGALIFGYIGDRYGRRIALCFSILGMALSTFCIGCVPSYAILGIYSTLLLTCFRLVQGICAGGECMGGGIFVVESISTKRVGFFGSIVASSGTLGAFFASIVSVPIPSSIMPSWVWRVPFITSIFIGFIGLYLRSTMEESPTFKNSSVQKGHNPIKELLLYHPVPFLCAIGIGALGTAPFYLIIGFLNSYLVYLKLITIQNSTYLNLILLLLCAFTMPCAGYIADKVGYSKIMLFSSISSFIYAYPFFSMIYNESFPTILITEIFFLLISQLFVAPINAFIMRLFPVRSRYTGIAFGYCIGMALFGGTTPYVSLWLIKWTGNNTIPYLYVMFICMIGFTAVLAGKKFSLFQSTNIVVTVANKT